MVVFWIFSFIALISANVFAGDDLTCRDVIPPVPRIEALPGQLPPKIPSAPSSHSVSQDASNQSQQKDSVELSSKPSSPRLELLQKQKDLLEAELSEHEAILSKDGAGSNERKVAALRIASVQRGLKLIDSLIAQELLK